MIIFNPLGHNSNQGDMKRSSWPVTLIDNLWKITKAELKAPLLEVGNLEVGSTSTHPLLLLKKEKKKKTFAIKHSFLLDSSPPPSQEN